MAKENTVYLYGRIKGMRINVHPETREIISGKMILDTIRRSYATDDMRIRGNIRWDSPCVYSRNPSLVEKAMLDAGLKENDMVLVKGSLCTNEAPRVFRCPNCGAKIVKEEAVIVYIDPLHIMKCESAPTEEDAYEILKDHDEISNRVLIMGTLCREPRYYEDPETKKKECQFQIASNRKRHILEDAPDKRTDYPWVKAFGVKAPEYAEVLHTDSFIFINGAIETREVTHKIHCEECGQNSECLGTSTEIVPYHIEYLKNCDIPVKEGEIEDGDE